MIHRAITGMAALAILAAACASPAGRPSQARLPDEPAPPVVPAARMFDTAITQVCFEALAQGKTPHQRLREADFVATDEAPDIFRGKPHDTLYRAQFASSPVLVSVAPGEARCEVIAVRGDPAELRLVAEEAISAFDKRGLTDIADYLSAIQRSPNYSLKFILRYAGMVGDPDGLETAPTLDDLPEDGIFVTE